MNLKHTCPTTIESPRVSAKWFAKTYGSLFRSDPTTSIQTLIDACQEKYGVEVPNPLKHLVVTNILTTSGAKTDSAIWRGIPKEHDEHTRGKHSNQ